MWISIYESRNFSFEAYGKTREEAREAMLKGLDLHAKQYECEADWYDTGDIYAFKISAGSCYRDGELLKGQP